MNLFLTALVLLSSVSLVALVHAIAHATEGAEDETGFHLTTPSHSKAHVLRPRASHRSGFGKVVLPKRAA